MTPIDPFDLPEWLATEEVTWRALQTDRASHLVRGEFSTASGQRLACHLMAVDQAWPHAVADSEVRERVHLTWRNGEVDLSEVDGDLTLLTPGSDFSSSRVMVALQRFTRAVGARADHYVAAIRLGAVDTDV